MAIAAELAIAPVVKERVLILPGKIGKCAFFEQGSKLLFDIGQIHAAGGTIELVVKRSIVSVSETAAIVTVGSDSPQWFFIGEQKRGLVFISRRKDGKGKYDYCSVLKSRTAVKEGEWTHLAFVWGFRRDQGSLMQIYVNGKTAAEKFYQKLGGAWTPADQIIGIGCNTADLTAPSFNGYIDEIRISNYPKTFDEINAAYEEFAIGNRPKIEPNTTLLLHFEDGASGIASTDANELSFEQIEKHCDEIIKDLPE